MKFFATTLALLLGCSAGSEFDNTVETLQSELTNVQPNCVKPIENYVKCFTTPEDIEETSYTKHPSIPAGTTLGMLQGSPQYEKEKRMVEAFRNAVNNGLSNEAGEYLATYEWLSTEDDTTPVMATSIVKELDEIYEVSEKEDDGDAVLDVWNTFTDAHITFGIQVIYDFREVPVSDDIEIPDFPKNFPPLTGGFYDIVVTDTSITYTLKDNRSASNLIFPEGTFDKYYFIFPSEVESASVISSDNIVPTVSILEPGTTEFTLDFFHTGLKFPSTLGPNVLLVSIGAGTDLIELGQVISIEYSLADAKGSKQVCGSSPVVECSFPKTTANE